MGIEGIEYRCILRRMKIALLSLLPLVHAFGLFPWWTKYIHKVNPVAPAIDAPVIDSPKLCVNCKFYLPARNPRFSKCAKFPKKEDNSEYYITGKIYQENVEYYYCSTARSTHKFCDKEAKMYEEKSHFT
jgi:hypothetical protein